MEEKDLTREQQAAAQEEERCQRALIETTEKLRTAEEAQRRLLAEFDNFRKRTEKERVQWMDAAQVTVLKEILAVVDDFERALQAAHQQPAEKQDLIGFDLIYKALQKMLTNFGVEELVVGQQFDPELHEALLSTPVQDKASGDIVAVLQKGYRHRGVVIRPAKVSVAQ